MRSFVWSLIWIYVQRAYSWLTYPRVTEVDGIVHIPYYYKRNRYVIRMPVGTQFIDSHEEGYKYEGKDISSNPHENLLLPNVFYLLDNQK